MNPSEKLYLTRKTEHLLSESALEIFVAKSIMLDALRDDDKEAVLQAISRLNVAVSIIQDFENDIDNIYFKKTQKKETRK